MKKCKKCKTNKPLNEFHKCNLCKDGLRLVCKSCVKIEKKEYDKVRYKDNKAKITANTKEYYSKNKKKYKDYNKEYRITNKKVLSEKKKKYDKNNSQKINQHRLNRRKTDVLFKLTTNYKSMLGNIIRHKGYIKNSKSESILGCTYKEFKLHIESLWQPWMNWDNYGNPKDGVYEINKTWDLDHIIPLSSAKTEDDIIRLNHYSNIQPLCSYNNRFIKKNNIEI